MRLVENYIGGLLKYADFHGRASRSEYWWFRLAAVVLLVLFLLLARFGSPLQSVLYLYLLGMLVPELSLGVRRLHDTGRSGWWLLLGLFLYPALIFLFCLPGQNEANRYGPPSEQ